MKPLLILCNIYFDKYALFMELAFTVEELAFLYHEKLTCTEKLRKDNM